MQTTRHSAIARAAAAACFFLAASAVAEEKVAKVTAVTPSHTATTPALPQSSAAAALDTRAETLGPGDQVRITVFRNPDLTTETRLSEKGTLTFPLIGEVQLSGLTPAQAGGKIADALKKGKFVVNPEVTVAALQTSSRQVSVLGNVNKPGRYPLDAATGKVTDLLALAGGISPTGSDTVTVVTTRNGQTVKQDVDVPAIMAGDLTKNIELRPGDTIYVGRAPMVYVYGEVQKGGAYRVDKDMTVMQAIAMSGGLTPRGTERGVQIHRKDAAGKVTKFEPKLTDPVRSDDVVYVKESLF